MTTVQEVQRVLTAPIPDLPTDLAKRYQAKLEGYRADFEPRGTLENDLVAEMAHLVLELEQTRAVAAAVVAIRVETAQAGAAAAGQGSFRDDRDARLAALHLQTLAFDATPDGERLRRHYDACERALHRTIATFLKLRKAAAIARCNTTEPEREYAGTAPVDPRPALSCSPSQEQWQPYAPVHEPSNGLPAAPANRQFNSRKPWRPDPRLTGEPPPRRNSRIERQRAELLIRRIYRLCQGLYGCSKKRLFYLPLSATRLPFLPGHQRLSTTSGAKKPAR